MLTDINFFKTIIMFVFTYYTNFKISNKKIDFSRKSTICIKFLIVILCAIICGIIRYISNYFVSMVYLVITISAIFDISNYTSSIINTVLSLSINIIINIFSVLIAYIPIKLVYKYNDNIISFLIMISIRIFFIFQIFKIKKFKYGFSFLNKTNKNNYFDLLILNISSIIIFSIILYVNLNRTQAGNLGIFIIVLSIISIITIKKSFDLYYQQKILIRDLNETKEELNRKKEEITKLEEENLNISKKSHSLVHKQKSLEYKLNQLIQEKEISEEIQIKKELENISKELYTEKETTELPKTEITQIDDMLKYMQAECKENKIDFDLQITGNIYKMTNNYVTINELEILLADHIKDAIIAVKHTDNINKSILVRLGKIDEIYSIYIYDSGIEFDKDTLEKLGKEPVTTHAVEGGTGIGFMNTFETLKKHKASLTIKELGKPNKDNYTKIIMIKFDNKNEFKIQTYK